MRKTIVLLLICLSAIFLTECKSDSTKKEKKTSVFSKLDSIDFNNNKSILDSGENITKAYIYLQDSLFDLRADMRKDHRFFGYAKPDSTSKKLLIFSIFTDDVDNNPFGYELGAHYDMTDTNGLQIKYHGSVGDFIKTIASDEEGKNTILYFNKKWIVLQNE